MIDIEDKVVDTIQNAFITARKGVLVLSEYVLKPASFPCVMVRNISTYTYQKSLDNSLAPHQAVVTMQIDYFSNKETGAKQEVKELSSIGDDAMNSMKFTLDDFRVITNEDRTISRATARYRAVVGKGVTSGTTTTHQIYRG